jgi:hypothetical protein
LDFRLDHCYARYYSIEAVLSPEKMILFISCASVERFYHEFAATLEAYNRNAKKYSD